jgi:hypothetical protein
MKTVTIRYDDGYELEVHVMPSADPRVAQLFPQHWTFEGREAAASCQREGKFDIESILARMRANAERATAEPVVMRKTYVKGRPVLENGEPCDWFDKMIASATQAERDSPDGEISPVDPEIAEKLEDRKP